jgi:hypothetical protein
MRGNLVKAWGRLVLVAMLGALVAACGGGGDDSSLPEFTPSAEATKTPGALPTPTPTASYGQDNPVDAYRGFMQAVQIAVGTANPDYPGLAQYGQGGALKYWKGRAQELKDDNRVILGSLGIEPKMDEMLSAQKGLLIDCHDDRQWHLFDRATGREVPGKTPKPPLYIKAGMLKVNDLWKVDETFDLGRGKGPCAAS